MDALPSSRRALDGHPSEQDPRDEFTARFTAESSKLSGLQDEGIAADRSADSAHNSSRKAFAIHGFHNKSAAQRIVDCGFTGPLDLVVDP